MKKDRKNKQHDKLLAKYLSGEMSESESRSFEVEFFVSDGNNSSIEKMRKTWKAMEGFEDAESLRTHKAWDKLYDRLHDEHLIPSQRVPVKSRLVHNLVRIAAVVLILLVTGAVVYINMSRKPAMGMVQLKTGNEANTLIKTLSDGSVIYIAQNSLFSYPVEFESGSRKVELKGEAFFDISASPGRPFIIETDEVLIHVVGTAFNVKTQNGDGFELFVDRGKVKVTLKKDPSHSEMVIAGEKISTIKNNLVKSKHFANETASWYKQCMHFKDESLQNIIHVLNRNFNTTFVLADNEIGKHKLTVTFQNETAATMTELICVTLNLKSQIINGAVVLSENKEDAKQN